MDRKTLDLLKILSATAKAAGAESGINTEVVNEIEKLWLAAQEVDSKGHRTRAASEALRKLAHPKGASTPLKRAVPAAQRKSLSSQAKAQASSAKALSDCVAALIDQAEFEALRDARPLLTNRKGDVVSSSKDEDVLWFIDWLKQHDVPPYILRRMSEWMKELLAKLMLDARDHKFEAPGNAWPKLFRAGVLEARGITPTPDEQRLLAEAAEIKISGSDVSRQALEDRLGRTLDISIEFAAAIEAILRERDTLTPHEQELLYCASQERWSSEAKMIAALLGEGDDKIPSIEAARQSIISTGKIASEIENDEFAKAVSIFVQAIRECDKRDFDGRHWPEAIAVTCQNTFSRCEHLDTSDTGFWSLLAVSLELSGLSEKYEDVKGFAFPDAPDLADSYSKTDGHPHHLSGSEGATSDMGMNARSDGVEDFASIDVPQPAQSGRAIIPYITPQPVMRSTMRTSRRYSQEDLA